MRRWDKILLSDHPGSLGDACGNSDIGHKSERAFYDAQFLISRDTVASLLRCLLLSNVRRSLLRPHFQIANERRIFSNLIFLLSCLNSLCASSTTASSCSVVGFVFSSFFLDIQNSMSPWALDRGIIYPITAVTSLQKQRPFLILFFPWFTCVLSRFGLKATILVHYLPKSGKAGVIKSKEIKLTSDARKAW